MGYIQEIRKMIGHYPIIAVGATVVVYNSEGKILLNLRADTETWGIPGGVMEPGETIEETARRELYEETGLIAKELKHLTVFSGPEFFFVYPNGDQMNCVIILFEALGVMGNIQINDEESLNLDYFSLDALPNLEDRAAKVILFLRNCKTTTSLS